MGIGSSAKKAVVDYLVGRSVRKLNETQEEAQEEDPLDAFEDSRPAEEIKDGVRYVSMSQADIIRRVVYDSYPDPLDVLRRMGWPPSGPDSHEMELKASAARMDTVSGLHALSHILTHSSMVPVATVHGWPQDKLDETSSYLSHHVLSIIGQLVELKLLEMGSPLAGPPTYESLGDDE